MKLSSKVRPVFIMEIPLNCPFRYNKSFYIKTSDKVARNLEWESGDFFDITPEIMRDAAAIRADAKDIWEER